MSCASVRLRYFPELITYTSVAGGHVDSAAEDHVSVVVVSNHVSIMYYIY